MKAVILAGGSGSRLAPVTNAVNKHLWPLDFQPIIYYSLAQVMRAGVRDVALVVNPDDEPLFRRLLGAGESLGISIEYLRQTEPRGIAHAVALAQPFVDGKRFVVVLGDGLFVSSEADRWLASALRNGARACVLALPVDQPEDFAVVELDAAGMARSLEEKPQRPLSRLAVPGLYVYPADVFRFIDEIRPSARGELEITDLNQRLIEHGMLEVTVLGADTHWLDLGTFDRWRKGQSLVERLRAEKRAPAAPHEVAWRMGWLSSDALLEVARRMDDSPYGEALRVLLSSGSSATTR